MTLPLVEQEDLLALVGDALYDLCEMPGLEDSVALRLAVHPFVEVQRCLALNPSLGEDPSLVLAGGVDVVTLKYLAATTSHCLVQEQLAVLGEEMVSYSLALNRLLHPSALSALTFGSEEMVVTALLARDDLVWLSSMAAQFVAGFPGALEQLMVDCDMEAAESLASSWHGSVASLREVVLLTAR